MNPLTDLNALPLPDLWNCLAQSPLLRQLLELARDEDLGAPPEPTGDITSLTCTDNDATITAHLRPREPGIISGLATLPLILDVFNSDAKLTPLATDGQSIQPTQTLATLYGKPSDILTLERTLLNLLGRMSGIATLTSQFTTRVHDLALAHPPIILDTRKTTPGLRRFEKYAVRCGGAHSHRLGLHDALLIKDNHLAHIPAANLTDWLTSHITHARADRPLRFVEAEADTLDQVQRMLAAPLGLIDIILLDNMSNQQLAQAVRMRAKTNPTIQLEASGGITLDKIESVARTGIDRISIGALTHAPRSLDLALDIN